LGAIFGGGWLPRPDFFVYADEAWLTVHPYLSSPGVHKYDLDPLCHQERLPQQASQHLDGAQHRRIAFTAHLSDHHLAQRLIVRHKVSLVFNLPSYYKQKIQAIPGVKEVVNQQWFGGQYKDDKPNNFFAQFGTDPQEIMKVYPEFKIPADQLEAWQHDRAGAIVDVGLANKFGWKIGDRLNITGKIFPVNLELTIRGIFTPPDPTQSIYFNKDYIDEGFPKLKGSEGFYAV